jgi:hypothetical protein
MVFMPLRLQEAVLILSILTINFVVIVQRAVTIQTRRDDLNFWATLERWGVMIIRIGLELLSVLFIAAFFAKYIPARWQIYLSNAFLVRKDAADA